MAANITKLFVILFLCLTLLLGTLVHCQKVPCMFVFGDSLFDNGNNNNLVTRAKVNYFPYGIDFPGGIATGRFSNGKNTPDALAEFLGFNKYIPPFASANGAEIMKGVNYASGAAGILNESGSNQGERVTMNMQLENHGTIVSEIARILGNATLAEEYLKTCLYINNIGNNDYLNNYLVPQYFQSSNLYTPQQYADLLIEHYSQQLTALYQYGARKVAVFTPGTLGCAPAFVKKFPSNGSPCNKTINNMAQLFNNMFKPLVEKFNTNLPNARFIYLNTTSIVSGDASLIGITNTNRACCVSSNNSTGLCNAGLLPCYNRQDHAFWDEYHLTQHASSLMAQRAYHSLQPSDAYPYDISHLVRQI